MGHTHNRQDQRIGVASTGLARSKRLEDPPEICASLRSTTIPTKGRHGAVEYLTAVYNFTEWFDILDITLTGQGSHASWKEDHRESNHVWRFVKRRDLAAFAEQDVQSCFPEEPHPADIIVLTKQRLSSHGYSQPPQVFVPNARFERLNGTLPSEAPRSAFSERQCA